MARPPAYKLYSSDVPTVHAGNDLQALAKLGRLLQTKLGGSYAVKDLHGSAVWEGENCNEK